MTPTELKLNENYIKYLNCGNIESNPEYIFKALRYLGYYYEDNKWHYNPKLKRNLIQEWIEFEKHPIGFSKYTQDELKQKQDEKRIQGTAP